MFDNKRIKYLYRFLPRNGRDIGLGFPIHCSQEWSTFRGFFLKIAGLTLIAVYSPLDNENMQEWKVYPSLYTTKNGIIHWKQ